MRGKKINLFGIEYPQDFNGLALDIFKYQSKNNPVYKEYLTYLGVNSNKVQSIYQIPFLPIEFFKTRKVVTGKWREEAIFESSGTTGGVRSSHYVRNVDYYRQISLKGFEEFYGSVRSYSIYALMPPYKEGFKNSSLLTMVKHWIDKSGQPDSGFYLEDPSRLAGILRAGSKSQKKRLLIGLSYALVDFLRDFKVNFKDGIIMETGGMKGRKEEITRVELHNMLKAGFGSKNIHSEYGMAELTSQAYSAAQGKFRPSPWIKIMIRDITDPFKWVTKNKAGGINVIDLSNINTCSFIETQDLGRLGKAGEFEVLGRFDHSDVRGCNLLAS